MSRTSWLLLVMLLAHASASTGIAAANPSIDRLERFRDLAGHRLATIQLGGGSRSAEDEREIYALLDEEIVQNVASGGLFASEGFLQDRLDGFAEVWGGATFRALAVGPLAVVACYLGDGANTVRVYGRLAGEAALLGTVRREGRPALHRLPGPPRAPVEFLVAWDGASSGRGTRELRLDVVRLRGDDVSVAWSTVEAFPEGLVARDYRVRGTEVTIRYELHYPGWTPGCDGQTEGEDVYRFVAERGALVRASRRQINDWHAGLHQFVGRILSALASGDRGALAQLVPDAKLRGTLPARLDRDTACDAREAGDRVSVAAVAEAGRPWTLTFLRAGARWRLTAASPMLQ
ncbi:MAG TPA: hypothetical protein VK548_03715 [Candidatus Acidoferrum sp.]|nr:hypothetical protein [Candidatus Acidoferrum sp.]